MKNLSLVVALLLLSACGRGGSIADAGLDGGAPVDGGGVPDGGVADGGNSADGGSDAGALDAGIDAGDAGPFQVLRILPADGTVLFDHLTEILIELNRDIPDSSLVRGNFELLVLPERSAPVSLGFDLFRAAPNVARLGVFLSTTENLYNWRWRITVKTTLRDSAGNPLDRPYQATYANPRRYYYAPLHFEDDGGVFQQEGSLFEYGVPDGGPGTCAPESGPCWTTGLSGKHGVTNPEVRDGGVYGNVPDTRLVGPPIDLSGTVNPVLRFYHWYELSDNNPPGAIAVGARVELDTGPDGGWEVIYPLGSLVISGYPYYRRRGASGFAEFWTASSGGDGGHAYTGPPQWERPAFDLRRFVGRTVRFSFHFFQEGSVTKVEQKRGWYIDEVSIDEVDPATLPPLDGGS
jgi:hypothetical protein